MSILKLFKLINNIKMKSIAFDISSPEFSEKQEEKSLFDFKPSENIQPNDIVGWYEKIYKEKDEDHSKIYEVDPLDENKIFYNRKSSLFTQNNVATNYVFANSYEMTSNEQFTLNFDNLQLNTEEIVPKYPEYEYNHYKSSFSHKLISHNRQKEEIKNSEFNDSALNEVTKAKINSKSKTEKIEEFYSDNNVISRNYYFKCQWWIIVYTSPLIPRFYARLTIFRLSLYVAVDLLGELSSILVFYNRDYILWVAVYSDIY